MLKCKGSAKGGGGSKSRKGGGSTSVTKQRKMQTEADKIMTLRSCIFDDAGKDRDVTLDFKPFLAFKRNGLDVTIEFFVGKKVPEDDKTWAFDLVKKHSEEAYDASGYGWDDADKYDELFGKCARLLIVRDEVTKTSGLCSLLLFSPGRIRAAKRGHACTSSVQFVYRGEVPSEGAGEAYYAAA